MNVIVLLLALFPTAADAKQIQDLRSFERPGDVTEDIYLSNPYSMEFSADGRLFIADRTTSQIHCWNADGSYKKTFGQQGEGPGELFFPYKIEATGNKLFVWSQNAQMSIFDLDGKFERSFKYAGSQVRNFAALSEHLFLFAVHQFKSPTDARVAILLVNDEGETVKTVKAWKNDMLLAPIEGNNDTTIKAFGAETDIQEAGDGTWYIGYSAEKFLYRVNAGGEIIGQKRFDLPTSKPTEADKELYYSMSFPAPNGQRISLKNLPNLKVDFNHNKAYYTQFTVMGDQVIFVLHPLGGTNGVGHGFSQGTYVTADLKTGKPLSRGRYEYKEDSMLLLRNGHILGLLVNEDDSFDILDMKISSLRAAGN
ncbi:MAG: 6-bladed beta-propeller [Acidobacteriota bacterium]|nr:6-bladed beta-propeller [Acidobacteriota bacterium]